MRVTHVNIATRTSAVDGIRNAVAHLARVQADHGVEAEVVDAGWLAARGGRLRAVHPLLARADVVHLHSVFRPHHVQIARWCRSIGVPYVVSPHSGLAAGSLARQRTRKSVWIAAFDARLLAAARSVICLTPAEQSEVRVAVPAARTTVVPNLGPSPLPGPLWTYEAGDPHVVTLARFDVWQKGLDHLAEIARRLPHVRFTVYGSFDGNDPRRARRLIADAPSNLHFCAPVHGADKAEALARASLYLQPSRWEGMSVALLEAFGHGTPCAVSPYIAESLGVGGSRVAETVPADPERGAAAVRTVLGDTDRLSAMSAAGRAWVRATTHPSGVLFALEAAYQGRTPDERVQHLNSKVVKPHDT